MSDDRCYRREALAQKNPNWSVPNARLYNEALYSLCLEEDHLLHNLVFIEAYYNFHLVPHYRYTCQPSGG